MRVSNMMGLLTAVFASVGLAGAANATPIEMSPNPASVNAVVGNDFSLRLDSGDSATNVLNFTVSGAGGCGGLCGSTAVVAIIFDNASVLTASDTNSGLFSSGNVIRGLVLPGGSVAGILIDFGSPSSERFSLTLDQTPTTATLYALNLDSLSGIRSKADILANIHDSTPLTFRTKGQPIVSAVPEPSAAVVFGIGLVVARLGLRRRVA